MLSPARLSPKFQPHVEEPDSKENSRARVIPGRCRKTMMFKCKKALPHPPPGDDQVAEEFLIWQGEFKKNLTPLHWQLSSTGQNYGYHLKGTAWSVKEREAYVCVPCTEQMANVFIVQWCWEMINSNVSSKTLHSKPGKGWAHSKLFSTTTTQLACTSGNALGSEATHERAGSHLHAEQLSPCLLNR